MQYLYSWLLCSLNLLINTGITFGSSYLLYYNKHSKKYILDNIISTLSDKSIQNNNYNTEDNGYKEIDDNVTSYLDKQLSGNINENSKILRVDR